MNCCCRSLFAVLCAVLPWLCVTGCGPDGADDGREVYPARPIKLIVPFGPGGGTDTFARIIEKAIEDEHLLPQPLVIINQGGAGATIGSRTVKDAAPDGYTVLILHDAILTAKFAKTVEYGPEAFEPVAATGEVGMVIAVDEDSPYRTLGELMEAAKTRPDSVSFGANIGALTHFAGLQLEQLTPGSAFRFAQIGGGADRFSNLKGGHIAVTGFSIEEFIRFRSEGLRGLAFFGAERHPGAPNVPTAREQGFNVVGSNTFYWWVPKGTPKDRIRRLAETLERAMQTKYVQRKMADIHCRPLYLRGPSLRRRITSSSRRYANVSLLRTAELPNLPVITAAGIGCLLLVVLFDGFRRRERRTPQPPLAVTGAEFRPRYALAALCIGLVLMYVAVMWTGWVGFRPATIAFVSATGVVLSRRRLPAAPAMLLLAAGLGIGIHHLLTRVFEVDLP